MKLCEKCHTENYDEAAYCKNCGHILEMGKTKQVVKFQTTFLKWSDITIWLFRVMFLSLPLSILTITLTYYSGLLLFVSMILFTIFYLVYNKRWKKFYLNNELGNAKELLIQFAFEENKSEENIKIKENSKGELKLKDKSHGAKGYFHLVTDKKGNVLLIGEKYNTQNLIRKVFGKEINFLETK